MSFSSEFKSVIFKITAQNFEEAAIAVFRYQSKSNEVYKSFLAHLRIAPEEIKSIYEIPFLPIEFFKTHKVVSGEKPIEAIFKSSGTTGQVRSNHFVSDLNFYFSISEHIFNQFYGLVEDFTFYALLPSYAARDDSSLIYMIQHFISKSKNPNSGFYLNEHEKLVRALANSTKKNEKSILWGVTFALLDLAEIHQIDLSQNIVIETGGMKGRRKELIRAEVHEVLKKSFRTSKIGSEYGMTELLSQAYAEENGLYSTPAWMKIILRNVTDPFEKSENISRGGVNIIDLANIDSCCFIETHDLGKREQMGKFSILGRLDNSEIRGCNLLL